MTTSRASPALSEHELDISASLFTSSLDEDIQQHNAASNRELQLADKVDNEYIDEDGDEAYIAAQQAAANRKASNLKGKSVKKGGGFQAMGLNATLLKAITRKGFSVPT
jgi:ATP-dependent RNA helicase DDX54/DBP10